MFARHTHTRMRPSSIVTHGWKSWASKLHPQLPLTNQESSRLLTALTSAFRQKLDEAHPRNTTDDPKQSISSNAVPKSATAFHSSAAHADKHLESVLTNPLLGGRILDYGTAKVELTKNPHRDPIELLEHYHEQGAASVAIAELALNHIRQSLERLPQSEGQSLIQKTEAGRRVFKWLLESDLYSSKSCIDNIAFIEHLVFFLVKEGREDNVWSWVKLDIGNLDDVPDYLTSSGKKKHIKINLYKYRGRGRVLHALLLAKLDLAGRGPGPVEIGAALDCVFKIAELKASAARPDHLFWIPMAAVSTFVGRHLCRDFHITRSDIDVAKFDRLLELMPVICDGAPTLLVELERAKLLLVHPKGRQPNNALRFFQEILGDNISDVAARFVFSIRTGGSSGAVHQWWALATATIYALRQQGSLEDADWLQAQCIKEFPRKAPFFQADMQKYRQHDMGRGARLDQQDVELRSHARVPFPTFA